MKFAVSNETVEAKVLAFVASTNGRGTFKALVGYYEGVGLHSFDIIKVDKKWTHYSIWGERSCTCSRRSLRSSSLQRLLHAIKREKDRVF